MSHAVDFIDNKLQYRFIDLDISVTLTLDDADFLYIPGFQATDSVAHLNVPRDLFAALFYYTIQYADLTKNDYTKMNYAMKSANWYSAPYSNSIVEVSKQINNGSLFQNLKYDYIRYILKQITGNNMTNGLFRNTDLLLTNIVSMDASFNQQILAILATCGTLDSPKLSNTFFNNPGRVLIDSILANDNVIETDNVERRNTLLGEMTSNATSEYNSTKAYYIIGTIVGETTSYCHFPIYIKGTTPILFEEYPDYIFYKDANIAKYTLYKSGDSANIAYYTFATKIGDTKKKVYFPLYLTNSDARAINKFVEYPSTTFYVSIVFYTQFFNTSYTSDVSGTYINATKTGTNAPQDYRVYFNSGGTHTVPITFVEYPGTTFYSDCRKYDSSVCYIRATKTGIDQTLLYYFVTDISNATYNLSITFAGNYTGTFYTNNTTGTLTLTNPNKYPNYDGFYLYGTPIGSTATQYYPVYKVSNAPYTTSITFVEYPGITYYTDYVNYSSETAYYLQGTKTGEATAKFHYPLYLNSSGNHTTSVTFENVTVTFYTSTLLSKTIISGAPSGYSSVIFDTPYYIYSTNLKYYYPIYLTSSGTHTTSETINGIILYKDPATIRATSYSNFITTNYSPTTPYFINGTKTGTNDPDIYFPIYINYPGHYCSTPITFINYPDLTFYTDFDTVNNQFYPFTFEYGDSLSVRITYKPKYNTYLGREIKDYSYQIYLDMGIEQNTKRFYTVAGDENPSNTPVAQITKYDSTIYTSLGTNKVFHYVLLNATLPSLYDSPYNFYPTLNDISNVSFDVTDTTSTGRWFFSVFCRPRTNGEYDSIGFDRFDTENLPVLNTWTSYNINTLTWTNSTLKGLSWKTVLDLPFQDITTPYGDIKANSQQQIMVLAISTDATGCKGSIRNVSVEFKDGRTIILT